jgi:predicted RecB family nuclease
MSRNCDVSNYTATMGASGQRSPLPRFLVREQDARGRSYWYLWDTLLGQQVGAHRKTEAEVHADLLARFGEMYGVQP